MYFFFNYLERTDCAVLQQDTGLFGFKSFSQLLTAWGGRLDFTLTADVVHSSN